MLLEQYRAQLRWAEEGVVELGTGDATAIADVVARPARTCACAATTSARRRVAAGAGQHRRARASPTGTRVELGDFFDQADAAGGPPVSTVISNPPYIPAPDRDILMPELWGGVHGNDLVLQLLKAGYDNVIAAVASYSDPGTTVRTAADLGYRVANFLAMGLDYGRLQQRAEGARPHPAALRRGSRLGRRRRLHGRRRPLHPEPRRPRRPRRPAAQALQLLWSLRMHRGRAALRTVEPPRGAPGPLVRRSQGRLLAAVSPEADRSPAWRSPRGRTAAGPARAVPGGAARRTAPGRRPRRAPGPAPAPAATRTAPARRARPATARPGPGAPPSPRRSASASAFGQLAEDLPLPHLQGAAARG